MSNYQYIIISVNEERKNKTNKLINNINISNSKVVNLKGITPNDNHNFINCIKDIFDKKDQHVVCCIKSHLLALEYALKEDSPEYSIILEDDVTFLKNDFDNIINKLINMLVNDEQFINTDMLHIGYIVDESYNHFISSPIHKTIPDYLDFKLFNSFYAFGAQGYIVRKSSLNKIQNYIFSENFNVCHELVSKHFQHQYNIIGFDHIINRILEFYIVSPPLIIERNEESIIGNSNKYYWDKYFKNFPNEKDKYML